MSVKSYAEGLAKGLANWSPDKHPRGRDGKFIEVGDKVKIFNAPGETEPAALGTVVGGHLAPDGRMFIGVREFGTQQVSWYRPKQIQQINQKAEIAPIEPIPEAGSKLSDLEWEHGVEPGGLVKSTHQLELMPEGSVVMVGEEKFTKKGFDPGTWYAPGGSPYSSSDLEYAVNKNSVHLSEPDPELGPPPAKGESVTSVNQLEALPPGSTIDAYPYDGQGPVGWVKGNLGWTTDGVTHSVLSQSFFHDEGDPKFKIEVQSVGPQPGTIISGPDTLKQLPIGTEIEVDNGESVEHWLKTADDYWEPIDDEGNLLTDELGQVNTDSAFGYNLASGEVSIAGEEDPGLEEEPAQVVTPPTGPPVVGQLVQSQHQLNLLPPGSEVSVVYPGSGLQAYKRVDSGNEGPDVGTMWKEVDSFGGDNGMVIHSSDFFDVDTGEAFHPIMVSHATAGSNPLTVPTPPSQFKPGDMLDTKEKLASLPIGSEVQIGSSPYTKTFDGWTYAGHTGDAASTFSIPDEVALADGKKVMLQSVGTGVPPEGTALSSVGAMDALPIGSHIQLDAGTGMQDANAAFVKNPDGKWQMTGDDGGTFGSDMGSEAFSAALPKGWVTMASSSVDDQLEATPAPTVKPASTIKLPKGKTPEDLLKMIHTSAINKGVPNHTAVAYHIGQALDPAITHEGAHAHLATAMTAAKLGGKQRARYKALLDQHRGVAPVVPDESVPHVVPTQPGHLPAISGMTKPKGATVTPMTKADALTQTGGGTPQEAKSAIQLSMVHTIAHIPTADIAALTDSPHYDVSSQFRSIVGVWRALQKKQTGKQLTYQEQNLLDQHLDPAFYLTKSSGTWQFSTYTLYSGNKVPVTMESLDQAIRENAVFNLIQLWAATSNDQNPRSLAMQEAARIEFDLQDTHQWKDHNAQADAEYALFGEKIFRPFLRGMYDNTQQWFKAHGVTHIVLRRGMKSVPPSMQGVPSGATGMVSLRPLNSFSSKLSIAKRFGNKNYGSILIEAVVPVERIIGGSATGFGCRAEYEYVVLGGTDQYRRFH